MSTELKYDKSGRLLFTKDMKKEYTILIPQMLPIHFTMIAQVLTNRGYRIEVLKNTSREVVDEGLKYVHNDTCYPALLVIGQMLLALKSGKYDKDKTALIITQTGGGCRASNYIHLLRKALKAAGLEKIPVISLNMSGMEKNPGFKMSLRLLQELIYSLVYGDVLMLLSNQTRPYENISGESDALVNRWVENLSGGYSKRGAFSKKTVARNVEKIVQDFANIKITKVAKTRVGIVGEIYVKFAPLGNNYLEEFLYSEGCEVVVPGLLDFILFKADNRIYDAEIYGGNIIVKFVAGYIKNMILGYQKIIIDQVSKYPQFHAPKGFECIRDMVNGYVGHGNKMGEGWLLTGEMLELISQGVNNIVCTQPFGCLPNHISGKGMLKKICENNVGANIVAIDYDPGATKINQENRIKLMLSREKAKQREIAAVSEVFESELKVTASQVI